MPVSTCSISMSLQIIGDKWTLLILRDMFFDNRRYFNELMVSEEKIASNVLASRMKTLVAEGLVTRRADPAHKQKAIYSLTEKGISLFPVIAQIGLWGSRNLPNSEVNAQGKAIMEGGPEAWERFMDRLRQAHLGTSPAAA